MLCHESIVDVSISGGRRDWAGGTKHPYGAHYASSSTILIAMLLNSLVGIVLFVSMLLVKNGMAGFNELASTVRWWTLIPGLLGSFFVFASISGYQNVGAATTIAVLVASQLIGGLVMDILKSNGVPLRALVGPVCGAVMLVVGAWLVARRQF